MAEQRKPAAKKPAPRKPAVRRGLTVAEHIDALRALGFTVQIPSLAEDAAKQQASIEALGFEREAPAPKPTGTLRGMLHAQHYVGSAVYGPGPLELEASEAALFQALLQQDQAAVRSLMDTAQYDGGEMRSYMLMPGRGADRHNKWSKRQVQTGLFEAAMGSDMFIAIDAKRELGG